MSSDYKNLILINASPKRTDKSMSEWLTASAEQWLKDKPTKIEHIRAQKSISAGNTMQDFEKMRDADALAFIFPLYVFCLPGLLMRYLEDFYAFLKTQHSNGEPNVQSGLKIYAVVNCGFTEPEINLEAVRVIQSFSEKIQADFRFGVLIGGGPMIPSTQNAPFMKPTMAALKSAFLEIEKDVIGGREVASANIEIGVNFPRKLYHFMGHRGWISSGKRNGLKKKDLYRRPYQASR